MTMQAIFENADFIAVDKPAEWLTVPGREGVADPRPCLGLTLQKDLAQQIWPVHRLDFEVSGLVLFAKSAAAHRAANGAFEGRQIQKFYSARSANPSGTSLASGQMFEWQSKLLRGKKRAYEHRLGKLAITCAKFLEQTMGQLKWQLEPLTGRAHQLRVHMAQHGFAIDGDELYGAKTSFEQAGIALRAIRLEFKNAPELLARGLPPNLSVNELF